MKRLARKQKMCYDNSNIDPRRWNMKISGNLKEKWNSFYAKIKPYTDKAGAFLRVVWKWIYRFRKVVMAIPVVYYALKLASYNMQNLPETVGLDLQSTGEFAYTVSRSTAVLGPLGVTGVCLVLMFFSRKSVFPWIISMFSLALPILVWVTNVYPA